MAARRQQRGAQGELRSLASATAYRSPARNEAGHDDHVTEFVAIGGSASLPAVVEISSLSEVDAQY